jgi:hypothetical protein
MRYWTKRLLATEEIRQVKTAANRRARQNDSSATKVTSTLWERDMRRIIILASFFLLSSEANAQWTDVVLTTPPTGYQPSPFQGQPVAPLNPDVIVGGCNTNQTVCGFSGINIQNFAEANMVNAQFASLNSQLTSTNGNIGTLNGQVGLINANLAGLDQQVSQLQAALNDGVGKAYQVATVAAAMKDAIPNDGDRFALRMNMASWNGTAAGGISFSANITNSTRLSLDYGRGENVNMFSGGVNFSFH